MELERRRKPRFAFRGEMNCQETRPLPGKRTRNIRARITDLSTGGLCALMERPPRPPALLRCEIPFARGRARIPTLAEVAWIEPSPRGRRCHVGLKFII